MEHFGHRFSGKFLVTLTAILLAKQWFAGNIRFNLGINSVTLKSVLRCYQTYQTFKMV
jgi:hypothetical protein